MQPANLLRFETSPYLLQHAGNPVHWRPWGPAALAEARTLNRPILLSVGYAACHWCHVMAHESFENAETAALMNRLFVNIKVDREERPDIDYQYMSALHALGEPGGWPLTMFLAPDGSPFWGGTYFPPAPRWGRPSFSQVLEGVAKTYAGDDTRIAHNTQALRKALVASSSAQPGDLPGPADLDAVAAGLLRMTDPVLGGLRGAPKFPNSPIFKFLWQNDFRAGTRDGRTATHLLLERMSQGGIYDHLGGGFSRYSTDDTWLVPHFEKMLYDNAQILELLAFAHADRPDALYRERAAETVGWLVRDMTTGSIAGRCAAFAASEDADSEGMEGKFYVWTEGEVVGLLGLDAPPFMAAYDVTEAGNWDGKTILRRVTPRGPADQDARLAASRARLLAARDLRVRPGRDDKVLADWNGMMIAALVRAAAVFDRPDWLDVAGEALDFLLFELGREDGRIDHAWRLHRVTAAGLLEDQAATARAALAVYEATGDPTRLEQAKRILTAATEFFSDERGGFYQTAIDAADVPLNRPRHAGDNATPSGNGLMAEAMARLFHLTGDEFWRSRSVAVLRAFSGNRAQLSAMPTLLAAADLLENAITVVVAGAPDADAAALLAVARRSADPRVVVLHSVCADALPSSHPAFGKAPPAGSAAYVCRAGTCSLPVSQPEALLDLLRTPRQERA